MVIDIRLSDWRWWCDGCSQHQIIKTSDSGMSRCEACANVLASPSFTLDEYAAFLCHIHKGHFRTDKPHPIPYKMIVKRTAFLPSKLLDSRFDFLVFEDEVSQTLPEDDKDIVQESEKGESQTSLQAEEARLKILKI